MKRRHLVSILGLILTLWALALDPLAVSAQGPNTGVNLNPTSLSLTPAIGSVGIPITISVDSIIAGSGQVHYKYYVNDTSYCSAGAANWFLIRDWTSDASVIWSPSSNGRKTVVVWAAEDTASSNPSMIGTSYEVGTTNSMDPISIELGSPAGLVNEPVTVNVIGGGPDLLYKFWVKSNSANWESIQGWSNSNTCTWSPIATGQHTLVVWTTDDINSTSCTGMIGVTYRVSGPAPQVMDTGTLLAAIRNGETAIDANNRLLVVDTRSSADFIKGHIKDALSAPLSMFAQGPDPIFTNGYDQVNTTAGSAIGDSWLAHIFINQLTNDFSTTYQNSRVVFYGKKVADSQQGALIASKIGYQNVFYLSSDYTTWPLFYGNETQRYYAGVESVDETQKSFVMTGFINNANFANVSSKGTHHAIVYRGGGLAFFGLLQANVAPFCFQELLTYLGASPEGNMAHGIYFGTPEEYGSKHTNGQKVEYAVAWEGAPRYYSLDEIYEERPSLYQPDPQAFSPVGIEPRIGGTRDSNLNWNPGCILCWYSCVCGITSNARANEHTWFADGGIYDLTVSDPRNYFAGRYYPRMDVLPGEGTPIRIKVTIGQ